MSHELVRLRRKLLNTPHLIEEQSFEQVLNVLNERNSGNFVSGVSFRSNDDFVPASEEDDFDESYDSDLDTGFINIQGPLSYKPVTIFGFDCGGANYQTIKADFEDMVAAGVKRVVLNIDSGGGEAFQCFPTAQWIRAVADENYVKIISFVDGMAASAAYALGCIADEVIMAPGSEIGSVGVLVRLMNDSKALEKEGYERTFITAGKEKIPYAEDGSFRKEFLTDIQEKVDVMYGEFTEHVANMRSISVESVEATQAKTFLPEKAIALGLADKVMTLEEFHDYLAETNTANQGEMMFKRPSKTNLTKNEETLDMTQLAELQTQVAELQAKLDGSTTELSSKAEALASLQSLVSEKDVALSSLQEKVTALEVEKVEAKTSARKASLSKVLAVDKVESTLTALSALDDAAFNTVLSSLSVQKQLTEQSDLMQELGSDDAPEVEYKEGKGKTLVVGEDSSTAQLLKQRLGIK